MVQSFGISTDSLSLEGQAECAVLCSAAVQFFRRECFRTTEFVVERAVKAYCSTKGKLNSHLQVFCVTLEKTLSLNLCSISEVIIVILFLTKIDTLL